MLDWIILYGIVTVVPTEGFQSCFTHRRGIGWSRVCMQDKPAVAMALVASWFFWFLLFLYMGI